MNRYQGTLFGWMETGLEGIVWALQMQEITGYDGLIVIEPGDHLEIKSNDGVIQFRGIIKPDNITFQRERPGSIISQPTANGLWVHWIQDGFSPEEWANFFLHNKYTGTLTRE